MVVKFVITLWWFMLSIKCRTKVCFSNINSTCTLFTDTCKEKKILQQFCNSVITRGCAEGRNFWYAHVHFYLHITYYYYSTNCERWGICLSQPVHKEGHSSQMKALRVDWWFNKHIIFTQQTGFLMSSVNENVNDELYELPWET